MFLNAAMRLDLPGTGEQARPRERVLAGRGDSPRAPLVRSTDWSGRADHWGKKLIGSSGRNRTHHPIAEGTPTVGGEGGAEVGGETMRSRSLHDSLEPNTE